MRKTLTAAACAALTFGLAGCGPATDAGGKNVLTGKVTYKGEPVPFVTLMAFPASGPPVGGSANEAGVYQIPDPPKGPLKFQFVVPGDAKGKGIPAKYTKPDNGVSCEFTGGKQTFDIALE